jgi:ABC-type branched-subunit amino acid transport system ATPase component
MLDIRNVSKNFGGVAAVADISFSLGDARIAGLIGPNGSGKTTLFHLVTGFYPADAGEVFFRGTRISGFPPHKISRAGLIRTFQHSRVLPFLTVTDNLIAAAPCQQGERLLNLFFRGRRVKAEEARFREKAREILHQIQLTAMAESLAGDLSYGQQKLLEIGRVLMAKPSLIILDEPTAGVNPILIHRLTDVLISLAEGGVRIFLIEHNMPFVSTLCETVFVMDAGRLIFSGPPLAAQRNPLVIDAYLGRSARAAAG